MRKYDPSQLLSQDQKPTYQQILKQKLKQSQNKLKYGSNTYIIDKIKHFMIYRQDKIFTAFVGESNDFFRMQWNSLKQKLPQIFSQAIINLSERRIKNVLKDLESQKLIIQQPKQINNYNYEYDQRNVKVYVLKGQSDEIKKKLLQINNALSSIEGEQQQKKIANAIVESKDIYAHIYSQQRKKQVEEFIKKKQQQRQQRKKKLEKQKIKQQQQLAKKQQQQKQIEQKQFKARKQQYLKKNMELHQKRNQEKAIRDQRNQQYTKLRKSLQEKPRLFQVFEKNFAEKVQYQQMQKKHIMINEKKSKFLHLDSMKIQQHEKNYQQAKKKKQQERQKKLEQFFQEQQRVQVRRHSSFQLSRIDKQSEQKQRAKQKFEKVKHYQSVVKQNFKPKVDEDKKKQMMTLIQQLNLNNRKKLKKTKLEDGKIVYQEIKQSDPRILGIMYLQKTKQMAAKARLAKGSSSVQLDPQPPKKKQINYLEQLRKSAKPRSNRYYSFVDKSNLTFDQKVDKIMLQSQKLNQLVKQNQMKLKFGKFKTSQQILNCKQEIDQSYIDIAKMKLKLIKEEKQ